MSVRAVEEALKEVELAKESNVKNDEKAETSTHTSGNESSQTKQETENNGNVQTNTNINTDTITQTTSDNNKDRHLSENKITRKVLCAVDPSHHSRVAFEWYLNNIWKRGDYVMIVYCPEPPHLPSFCIKDGLTLPSERWREIISETNNKVKNLESDYETLCHDKKLKYTIRFDMSKHPGEEIIRLVEKEGVRMIVMGCRGVGAVKRFFLGSVSEYVTRHSKIPCVVVPNEHL